MHERMAKRAKFLIFGILVPLFIFPTMLNSYFQYYFCETSESPFRLPLDGT